VMTSPIKKRIKTNLFTGRKHRLYRYKNVSRNFLPELKKVNVNGRKIRAGMRAQNSSLFEKTEIAKSKKYHYVSKSRNEHVLMIFQLLQSKYVQTFFMHPTMVLILSSRSAIMKN